MRGQVPVETSGRPGEACLREVSSPEESFSLDRRLNNLLKTVVGEVRGYAEGMISEITRLNEIGSALSAEKNTTRLLEMILTEARRFTNADAGTLYRVDAENGLVRFEILHNDTMKVRMGGTSNVPVTLPPIPLEVDGRPNFGNVSSFVAQTGRTVNIPDVYQSDIFDFTGPRKYDAATGYRSISMLVMPMKDHENEIIGVLQLLNALDSEGGGVIPFPDEYVGLIESLASQAAVALTNAQLIEDLTNLLHSFIKSIAAAIDAKSPYTGGHVRRVVDLSLMLAEKVNACENGPYANVVLSPGEMEELRLAAWMHDVGKITTPEHVVDKRTKLETIFDREHLVKTRFDLIRQTMENDALREKINAIQSGEGDPEAVDRCLEENLGRLEDDLAFVLSCNSPAEFMSLEKVRRLRSVAAQTFVVNGESRPYLLEDELANLSITKGSLTEAERKIIENHTVMTSKMLKALPFPKMYSRVPEYAAGHHEKLDGSGYPFGLRGDEIPLQARIMAIADVFEALTAKDRPYKQAMKLSQAVKILGFMVKDGHVDRDLFDLFVNTGVYRTYAERELNPEQIDD